MRISSAIDQIYRRQEYEQPKSIKLIHEEYEHMLTNIFRDTTKFSIEGLEVEYLSKPNMKYFIPMRNNQIVFSLF